MLAAGHLLRIGARLLAQIGLIVCPECCARRVHGFALTYVHACQVLLPDLHMHCARHDLCALHTSNNCSALSVKTCLLQTLVCLRTPPTKGWILQNIITQVDSQDSTMSVCSTF